MKRETYWNMAGYVTSYDFEGDTELEDRFIAQWRRQDLIDALRRRQSP